MSQLNILAHVGEPIRNFILFCPRKITQRQPRAYNFVSAYQRHPVPRNLLLHNVVQYTLLAYPPLATCDDPHSHLTGPPRTHLRTQADRFGSPWRRPPSYASPIATVLSESSGLPSTKAAISSSSPPIDVTVPRGTPHCEGNSGPGSLAKSLGIAALYFVMLMDDDDGDGGIMELYWWDYGGRLDILSQ